MTAIAATQAAGLTDVIRPYEAWYRRYERYLTRRRASWRDDLWEHGVLELVSPLEPHRRDEARKLGLGLPWGGRLDVELYWRILYAAHAETFRDAELKPLPGARAPIRTAVLATLDALEKPGPHANPEEAERFLRYLDQSVGRALYEGLRTRAADEVRIRMGRQTPPKPHGIGAVLRVRHATAMLASIDGEGGLTFERETKPPDAEMAGWSLDVKRGRWTIRVMPWELPFT